MHRCFMVFPDRVYIHIHYKNSQMVFSDCPMHRIYILPQCYHRCQVMSLQLSISHFNLDMFDSNLFSLIYSTNVTKVDRFKNKNSRLEFLLSESKTILLSLN